jgi:hypothetical protein
MKHTSIIIKSILITCLFLFSVTFTEAQEKQKKKFYGGTGYFMTGWQGMNFDNLNAAFKDAGYPTLSNGLYTIGGGGHSFVNRFILGGEGQAVIGGNALNQDYTVNSSGGYGFFDFGYVVVQKGGLLFYPMVGIGGGGISYTLKENRGPYDFPDLMEDPNAELSAGTGGMLFNGQVGLDYQFNHSKSETERGGLMIGIRAGYNYCTSSSWDIHGTNITNHPSTVFRGFFFKVIIGGGGFAVSN